MATMTTTTQADNAYDNDDADNDERCMADDEDNDDD